MYCESTKSRDSFKEKAEVVEVRIKSLEELNAVGKARETKLKDELRASKGTIWELEA